MGVIYEPGGRALEYSLLALNHYRGCSHGCVYCYARKMTANFKNQDFDNPEVKSMVLSRLIDEAPRWSGTDKRVLLCFTCDPYQPLDEKEQLTRAVLHVLKENDIPFQILTKGGLRATRDFDLYGPNDTFATTLTYTDEHESRAKEPGASVPVERMEAIRLAHKRGIETWVSLEPVMDVEQTLDIIRMTSEFVDLYKIGKLNHYRSDIDWREFGIKAIYLCNERGKKYYIKNDLAASLKGVEYTSIDTRRVKRN